MSLGACRLRFRYFCFQVELKEENIMGSTDESYDLGCQPSPSSLDMNDHSNSQASAASNGYCRTDSHMSACSEANDNEWVPPRSATPPHASPTRLGMKKYMYSTDDKHDELETIDIELEMMKEKFSKLLLGEDMSGSGKGVCSAVTISNAITNLYATIFGNALKLEPLKPEKKMMWEKEMDCLLSVCDYIVELVPQDGYDIQILTTRPRTDIQMNLPALRKLDGMLIGILESFKEKEFWYAEQGNMSKTSSRATSFRKVVTRKDEKWWLPVPCIPSGGLSDSALKHLKHQRDCANQIHKAAMAINNNILHEMEVPESYIAGLPKSGKSCLGDAVYKCMYNAEIFSPEQLLDTLKINSEHEALELADRVEASMYTWKQKAEMTHSRSWHVVKDFKSEADRNDKNHILAERAATLLFSIKHRYPELSQTTLDTCKIQYNSVSSSDLTNKKLTKYPTSVMISFLTMTNSMQDVGQAILESYSRVLEGLAFNIVAWINDVLSADNVIRNQQDQ